MQLLRGGAAFAPPPAPDCLGPQFGLSPHWLPDELLFAAAGPFTEFWVPTGSAVRVSPSSTSSRAETPAAASEPVRPANVRPLTVLLVVPTLDTGAADAGALDIVRILADAGHRAIVMSRGGRMEKDVWTAGGEFVFAEVDSKNPFVMLRNAAAIARMARERGCDIIHAHGRAPAWSAYIAARVTRLPFLTSWYKGFREQNFLKRIYNSVMIRGDRIVAPSDQIADLIVERYGVGNDHIEVIPVGVDVGRFDPDTVTAERIEAVRKRWGVGANAKVILVVGRLVRRKGHHIVVQAAQRLKDMGVKDFVCVFAGEDQGRSRYSGELWDLVVATNTADVVRITGPCDDLPALYAAASVVVSAATQPEGLQRSILEAQAMGRPVIASDLGAGPEVLLAPPAVSEDRMTGLRFSSGDAAGLATALVRLFSLPVPVRQAIGARGREWVKSHFNPPAVAELTLKLYAETAKARRSPVPPQNR
jgi:glycosyltransferase involved in cell wall biosynthesis